jgi:prepilin-type N-terminal cleavage/methylation domain-containing protein
MKQKMQRGFTLVELLIVIALIAVLSVAVLATINPIEQSNKARDAKVQNDAAEVLNAYERYYTSTTHYPWMDVVGGSALTVDTAYTSRSIQIGFGLCGNGAAAAVTDACEAQSQQGRLIETQELKDSFLTKPYTRLVGDVAYNYQEELYVYKQPATTGNSIYVCYVPKARANRVPPATSSWKLKALSFAGGSENAALPTTFTDATPAQITAATYDTLLGLGGNATLFRCVPE